MWRRRGEGFDASLRLRFAATVGESTILLFIFRPELFIYWAYIKSLSPLSNIHIGPLLSIRPSNLICASIVCVLVPN